MAVTAVSLRNQAEFQSYCDRERGSIKSNDTIINNFCDLQDGHTYLIDGGYWNTVTNDMQRQQAEDTQLKRETTLIVNSSIDSPNTHIHNNYIIKKDDTTLVEYDGLIHIGGNDIPYSKVYLIECQYNPPISKIDKILDKVEIFKSHIADSDHFKSVTNVQCVLGGRIWDPKVIARCQEHKIWRVAPNGLFRYTLHRNFVTLCKRLLK
jgi:hypothetical protein